MQHRSAYVQLKRKKRKKPMPVKRIEQKPLEDQAINPYIHEYIREKDSPNVILNVINNKDLTNIKDSPYVVNSKTYIGEHIFLESDAPEYIRCPNSLDHNTLIMTLTITSSKPQVITEWYRQFDRLAMTHCMSMESVKFPWYFKFIKKTKKAKVKFLINKYDCDTATKADLNQLLPVNYQVQKVNILKPEANCV